MHEPFSNVSTRFSLISLNGEVIYDSEEFSRKDSLDNHLLRIEIQESLKFGEGFTIRKSSTQQRVNAYFSMIFYDIKGKPFILRGSQNYTNTRKELNKILFSNIFFFLILNLLIHIAYKKYIKRDFLFKLEGIKKFLIKRTLSENREYNLMEDDWLIDFWRVAEYWQKENIKTLHELKSEKKLLNDIISSVESAILLLDNKGNIILKNNQLSYLFYKGNTLISSIKSLKIFTIINENYLKNKNTNDDLINYEIYLDEYKKYYLLSIKKIHNGSILVLIKDITNVREFIEIQKKFISNVSHELKTPLTNIKGYLIALDDAGPEEKINFLSIIHNNLNKFENIIQNFLGISKIEASNIINIEKISVSKLYNTLKMELSQIGDKKNIELIFKSSKKIGSSILIDYDKIYTILRNIIENGIIYSHGKKPFVSTSLLTYGKYYVFIIFDNGIGIDSIYLDKIFNRFYRVSESRTSNIAGTGLGLSIVDEVVKKLKGSIKVSSSLGNGTKFIIKIPK